MVVCPRQLKTSWKPNTAARCNLRQQGLLLHIIKNLSNKVRQRKIRNNKNEGSISQTSLVTQFPYTFRYFHTPYLIFRVYGSLYHTSALKGTNYEYYGDYTLTFQR